MNAIQYILFVEDNPTVTPLFNAWEAAGFDTTTVLAFMSASTAAGGGGGTSGGMSSLYSKYNIFNIKCVSSNKNCCSNAL